MYEFIEGQVVRNEFSTIPYTWIRNKQPAKSICIMLPGLGYTTQRPLFHYATGVCLDQNVDVLHINYQFAKNDHFKKLPDSEQDQWMYEDVCAVADEILKDYSYDQVIVLSKSIGAIPMAKEWGRKHFTRAALGIWITPLIKIDEVYQVLLNTEVPSLCIIGDQDHHFVEERITSLENNHLIQTLVVPNTEHSLEVKGDVLETLEAMKEVMKSLEDFITKNKI
jgi:hypothetical protein